MDRTELINQLQPFAKQCEKERFPIKDIFLEEAYPGIKSTSFIVKIVATDWLDNIEYSQALHKLLEILWKTTSLEIRKKIFVLALYSEDELHLEQAKHREAA